MTLPRRRRRRPTEHSRLPRAGRGRQRHQPADPRCFQIAGASRDGDRSPDEALGGRRREFDVAILDLHMPELDGMDLAEATPIGPARSAAAVVILSSIGQPGDRRRTDRDADQAGQAVGAPRRAGDALPASPGRARPDRRRPGARGGPAGGTTRPGILLAEDNTVNQKLALRLLERMGLRADVAATAGQPSRRSSSRVTTSS